VIVAVVTALAMEPLAALAHRRLMHRPRGWSWHASHHRVRRTTWERNDLFPVAFASVTVVAMAVGTWVPGWWWLFHVGAGVTAYGAAYALVHDVCVHGRLTGGRPVLPVRWLRWVAAAHAVHHADGRAPYGFLVPVVPSRLRPATASLRPVDTRARVAKTS
jgi:beta-carotene 3-hydroxylase